MGDGRHEVGANCGDSGARAGGARGREKAECEERHPGAHDEEAPARTARRQDERRIARRARGDGPGSLLEIGRRIDREQRGIEEQDGEAARRDGLASPARACPRHDARARR